MKYDFSHEKKNYRHFGECIFISNGVLEAAIAFDFGIRIIRFCVCGGDNVFYEQPENVDYLCTPAGWRVFGGHRLAFAPESAKTYWPDILPVGYTMLKNGVIIEQSIDEYLYARKIVEICFSKDKCEMTVNHRIHNTGPKPLEGAPWAITAVASGGECFVPFGPRNVFCDAPGRFISLWNETSLADARLKFTKEGVEIRHLAVDDYFKAGFRVNAGQIRYKLGKQLFTKRFKDEAKKIYPDNNVNCEVFACKHMMELETLAPMNSVAPGGIVEHQEEWRLDILEENTEWRF
jgi:hypothetical protein